MFPFWEQGPDVLGKGRRNRASFAGQSAGWHRAIDEHLRKPFEVEMLGIGLDPILQGYDTMREGIGALLRSLMLARTHGGL